MGTTEAEQIVTRFVAAWDRHDVDEATRLLQRGTRSGSGVR